MIEQLKIGWQKIRQHSKLMLVMWLVVIFPLLFIYIFQSFVIASNSNINTITTTRVSSLQDSIQYLLLINGDVNLFMQTAVEKQSDLTKIRIVEEVEGQMIITHDLDPEKIGDIEHDASQYRTALINIGESFIFNYQIDGRIVSQVFRAVETQGRSTQYIFTEHDYTTVKTLMDSRIQKSYLILTFIFLFLIALAYWIASQINFQKRYLQAEEKLHERNLFINSLAHELRAPLTAIRGYASLIEESTDVPKVERDYGSRIKKSSIRLVSLVNDFLEAARIQAGVLRINRTRFAADKLVTKVIEQLEPNAKAKSLKILSKIPESSNLLNTDIDRLEQILTNIISNAIKYTEKGTIEISFKQTLKYDEFVVADNGDGISADDQKKLFNPFVRVGSADKNSSISGSGLGMWITKQLLEQLDGTIALESIKGVGTHVIIRLKRTNVENQD